MQKRTQKFLLKAASHLIFAKAIYRAAKNSTKALADPHFVQIRIGFEVHFFGNRMHATVLPSRLYHKSNKTLKSVTYCVSILTCVAKTQPRQ
jgi:hypothetical protein